ncbi:MAG: 30S ribosomal protein S4 [Candidatus Komeilibacteria bacterium RIFCSPLOWO2_01_FULL_52_15]|uniref:Small ribosomal subunit protein uS4 n=2 Tax=Candidatus Komeiliibacteriota TaxID=1817908 RepID=A0A1G2BMQ3_9BACT|nr:MAG: 30S ribosomal protein S4 [Candidatus Komeilibacteria bacterium RIFCSPHIGHO2_01_FULL_52_14]OGY90425.1 MAG: 30S ribosomal protein S4 [Candidatus Komeilibacteria bacterium RIFCSPLOWO2_01_FULL_52_15]
MARKIGPKHKLCRTLGVKLCDSFKCPVTKRNYPPGQHGPRKMRTKLSNYGKQQREKQKAKFIYGLLERQFHTTFERARRLPGSTGTNLLVLLEKRLDNVVYRSGLATTKQAARQLVNHGHFAVNGKNLDIPSYTVRVGDTIAVKETKRNSGYWKSVLENTKKTEIPGWLTVDPKALSIRIVSEPKPEELPQNIELSLIVEFYSR